MNAILLTFASLCGFIAYIGYATKLWINSNCWKKLKYVKITRKKSIIKIKEILEQNIDLNGNVKIYLVQEKSGLHNTCCYILNITALGLTTKVTKK